jgi:hypothetical protein
MVPRPLVRLAAALLLLLVPTTARADDAGRLETGITAYETNRFDECIQHFKALLTPGGPGELKDKDARNRGRMYFAACLTAKRQLTEADEQLDLILNSDLDYAPNPSAFSSKLIGRFRELKIRHQEEIDKLTAERLAEAARLLEERKRIERLEKERREAIERMAREQVLVTQNSRVLALIPFGAGQFQNRQSTLGLVLLTSESLLAATSVVSYLVKDGVDRAYKPSVSDPEAARSQSKYATLVNRISFGAFVGVAVAGVVHGQLTFVPSFRDTKRRDLPPPVTGALVPGGGVMFWQGSF